MTEDDSMLLIRKEIDEERARRPKGWSQRCELCCFWEGEKKAENVHAEDVEGQCHRSAPRSLHHYTAEGIGLIAWAIEELANVEHSKFFSYAHETTELTYWPTTAAHDWCGDFMERK